MKQNGSVGPIWTGQLEYVECNLCGSRKTRTLVAFDESWRVARCAQCGLAFVNPRPVLADLIAGYKRWGVSENEPENIARWLASTMPALHQEAGRIVDSFGTKGHLLDVGSSGGFFVKAMKDAGWDAVGVEPSETLANYAAEQFGVDTILGTIEDADLPEDAFDVVTMWYVLEHVMDPRRVVDRVISLLKPGGALIARVPNLAFATPFRFLRKLGFDCSDLGVFSTPWHLYFFDQSTMRRLLENAGFHVVHLYHGKAYRGQHMAYNLAKELVTEAAEGLRRISFGRLFWGPAIVVRAAKA